MAGCRQSGGSRSRKALLDPAGPSEGWGLPLHFAPAVRNPYKGTNMRRPVWQVPDRVQQLLRRCVDDAASDYRAAACLPALV